MLRKLLICSMLAMLVLATAAIPRGMAQELTLLDKAVAVEKIIYGAEQTGSLIERITKLEKDIYGQETKDALVFKLDRVYNYTKETAVGAPSFIIKLSAVEWALTHTVTTQPGKARIENIERVLLGNVVSGAFDERLNKLLKLAYTSGQAEVSAVSLTKDTLVKIKMISALDTRKSRPGDQILFQVAEDVYSNGILAISKGAQGTGKVLKVEPRGNFGRDAKLELSFDAIEGVDGASIEVVLGEKAKEETKSMAKAAGASVAGMVVLGPFGVVGGAFVHGQDIVIPAGAEMYIQTKSDIGLYGIKVN